MSKFWGNLMVHGMLTCDTRLIDDSNLTDTSRTIHIQISLGSLNLAMSCYNHSQYMIQKLPSQFFFFLGMRSVNLHTASLLHVCHSNIKQCHFYHAVVSKFLLKVHDPTKLGVRCTGLSCKPIQMAFSPSNCIQI